MRVVASPGFFSAWRSLALPAKAAAWSLDWRCALGSAIHSRMTLRRTSWSGFFLDTDSRFLVAAGQNHFRRQRANDLGGIGAAVFFNRGSRLALPHVGGGRDATWTGRV